MDSHSDDEKLLTQLAQGDEASWRRLYEELRNPFRLFFIRYGAMPPEEALELYQEAMVALHRNCLSGKLKAPLKSSIKTYLIGIGKILLRKKGTATNQWDDNIPEVAIEAEVDSREEQRAKAELARRLLEQVGPPCNRLLELFFVFGYAMDAIAEELGLPSAGAARKRKYDCLQKIRSFLNGPKTD